MHYSDFFRLYIGAGQIACLQLPESAPSSQGKHRRLTSLAESLGKGTDSGLAGHYYMPAR